MSKQSHAMDRTPDFDARDRLIVALYAELKAERATREALDDAIARGVVSRDVLAAIVSDPVPVITSDDVAVIETVLARDLAANNREDQS